MELNFPILFMENNCLDMFESSKWCTQDCIIVSCNARNAMQWIWAISCGL